MRIWVEPEQVTTTPELEGFVGGNHLLAQVLVQRGISDVQAAKAFIDPHYYQPAPPMELPDMERAVDRIERAIHQGDLIGVWGDFDVDGQTATALLVSMLKALGAQVVYHIPVRSSESHGINLPALKRLLDKDVGLLLTCDTGIAEHEAVDYARERKVDVIITDHHELPPSLPEAFAILNPKLLHADSSLVYLPGVGVAYKLAEALYLNSNHKEAAENCLDLVALGIVADVAVQSGDTRYLLQRGLEVLRRNQRLGLSVLMELAELAPHSVSEEHIGFVIAPRLNSIGRLGDANPMVEFLTTSDLSRARILAQELEALNARRRLLTDQVFQAAQSQIERDPTLLAQTALVLSHPTWPSGVIGIVAGRLAERYHRPVALISAPTGDLARGSARSIEGCDIYSAIAACQDLLVGFGGHTMAAGFSLKAQMIPDFRRALAAAVRDVMDPALSESRLVIDGYFSLGDLSLEFVENLEKLAPFGPGNMPLTLASKGLTLQKIKSVGRNDEHLQIWVEDEQGNVNKVIWWQGAGWPTPEPLESGSCFDLAYTVRTSNYLGQREIQIEWTDVRPSQKVLVEVISDQPPIQVKDFRDQPDPLSCLKDLLEGGDVQVWCEGEDRRVLADQGIMTCYRDELVPYQNLAIWTAPPGRDELLAALQATLPAVIHLFSLYPTNTQIEPFLKHLAGLCKFTINHDQGKANLVRLSGATAQRERTVTLGISWLEQSGFLVVVGESGQEILLNKGGQKVIRSPTYLVDKIKELLDETAAYRDFFSRAETNSFLPIKQRTPPTS